MGECIAPTRERALKWFHTSNICCTMDKKVGCQLEGTLRSRLLRRRFRSARLSFQYLSPNACGGS
jgi:hypothetical protein